IYSYDPLYTYFFILSLHDALPIYGFNCLLEPCGRKDGAELACGIDLNGDATGSVHAFTIDAGDEGGSLRETRPRGVSAKPNRPRSEEHTSELQSLAYLVCRLLLEK